ncbi:MAG: hypothetical protein LBS60_06990 [Deltaproteobacteria bacterium]|nr:hypothetical protein [Deltaproteobacteria bacterium]
MALPDSEVQRLKAQDPLFAWVEDTIVDTWRRFPSQTKREVRQNQIDWVQTDRDLEAQYLMDKGLPYADAYIFCTAARNNQLVDILPPNHKKNYVHIDLELLVKTMVERKRESANSRGGNATPPAPQAPPAPTPIPTPAPPTQTSATQIDYNSDEVSKNLYSIIQLPKDVAKQALHYYKIIWIIVVVVSFMIVIGLVYHNPIK